MHAVLRVLPQGNEESKFLWNERGCLKYYKMKFPQGLVIMLQV